LGARDSKLRGTGAAAIGAAGATSDTSSTDAAGALRIVTALLLTVFVLAGALFLHAPPGAIAAPQDGVVMEVSAGLDGLARYGTWMPVRVTVTNGALPLAGAIVAGGGIELEMGQEPYRQDIALEPGSVKEYTLFVPTSTAGELEVRLLNQSGQVIATDRPALFPNNGGGVFAIGTVPEGEGGLHYLSGLMPYLKDNRWGLDQIAELAPADLPEHPSVYRSIDILVVNSSRLLKMTDTQIAALSHWVTGGGHLVFGQNAVVARAGPQALGEVGEAGRAIAGAVTGEPTLTVNDGVGTIAASSWDCGDGTVSVLAFDPEEPGWASWPASGSTWRRFLQATHPSITSPPQGYETYTANLAYVLRSAPSLKIPPVLVMFLALVGYALLIGPITYLVLKRVDRREWVWFAAPALAIALIGVIYVVGPLGQGWSLLLNRVTVVDVNGSTGSAEITTHYGLFAPSKSTVSVPVDDNSLLMRTGVDYFGPGRHSEELYDITVFSGSEPAIRFGDSGRWGMRYFRSSRFVPEFGRVTVAITSLSDNGITGTVKNDSTYTIEDGWVIVGGGYASVGQLNPWEAREFNLVVAPANASGPTPGSWDSPIYQIYSHTVSGGDEAALVNFKRMVVENALRSEYKAYEERKMPAVFFGWLTEPLRGEAPIQRGVDFHMRLIRAQVALEPGPGPFAVSPMYHSPSVSYKDATASWHWIGGNSIEIGKAGTLPIVTHLMVPSGGRVETIEIAHGIIRGGTTQTGGGSDAVAVTYEIQVPATGQWQQVAPADSEGDIILDDGWRYIGSGDRLFLRVTVTGPAAMEFPVVTIRGVIGGQGGDTID